MLIQVGPYPPPIGGVSIHIARLKEHLDRRGIPVRVWNLASGHQPARGVCAVPLRRVPYRLMLRPWRDLVHYHVSGYAPKERLARFHRHLLPGKRSVFTLHGDVTPVFREHSAAEVARVLDSFDAIVCVKEGDAALLRERGVKTWVQEICPFIPPADAAEPVGSSRVTDFLERHERVICANGAAITQFDGHELYGLDLCVELLGRLRDLPGLGLVFYLSRVNDEAYVQGIQRRIEALGLTERVCLNTVPGPFHAVIRRSALFVRPTVTDGDALSIREALHAGVPVVASDVVRRPAGCRLFANRKLDSFEAVVRDCLARPEEERARLRSLPDASGLEPLLELYRQLGLR